MRAPPNPREETPPPRVIDEDRLPRDLKYSPQWQRWTELPDLPELDPTEGPLPLQMHDWLVQLGPMVSDMSSGATYYWREVLLQARTYYERWLSLSPLERSQFQVSRSPELCEPRFVRAEQRLIGMILKAFPESLKQECIAGGLMSSVQLIWRALVRYQPGGAQERQLLLGYLTGPPKAKSVQDAVQLLRRYSRWGIRSQALGITRPDPSLMLRGLESSVWPVISPHQEATFRLQILKVQLGLDHVPRDDESHGELHADSVIGASLDSAAQLRASRGEFSAEGSQSSEGHEWILVDGGATAPLRQGTHAELSASVPVEVGLATGKVNFHLHPNGSLLSQTLIEPIVPLGELISVLSCRCVWEDGACRIVHPARGELPVRIHDSCPQVPRAVGLGLISELETRKARKLTRRRQVLEVMRVVGTGVSVADAVAMMTAAYQEAECDFESFEWQGALVALLKAKHGVANDLLPHVLPGVCDSSAVRLNRRRRRSFERAGQVYCAVSGAAPKSLQQGACVLEVERELGGLLNDQAFAYLAYLAIKGKLVTLIGGLGEAATIENGSSCTDEARAVFRMRHHVLEELMMLGRVVPLGQVGVEGSGCRALDGESEVEARLARLSQEEESIETACASGSHAVQAHV